jgi:hypothetical protein
MNYTEAYVPCACRSPQHLIVLQKFDDNERYISFQLSPFLPFWQRVIAIFKYLTQPRQSVIWDEVILDDKALYDFRLWLTDNKVAVVPPTEEAPEPIKTSEQE